MQTLPFSAALDEHLRALQARDIARFRATLAADCVVIDGRGAITEGRDMIAHAHADWFASPDAWTFDYTVRFTREFDGAGLALIDVTYRQRPADAPSHFLLSLFFARDAAGEWRFVYDQNTALA